MSNVKEVDEMEKRRLLKGKGVELQPTMSNVKEVDEMEERRLLKGKEVERQPIMSNVEKVDEMEKRRFLKGKQVEGQSRLQTTLSAQRQLREEDKTNVTFQSTQGASLSASQSTTATPSSQFRSVRTCLCSLLQWTRRLRLQIKGLWNGLHACFTCIPNKIDTLISPAPGLDASVYFRYAPSPVAYLIVNDTSRWSRLQVQWTSKDLQFVMREVLGWFCQDGPLGFYCANLNTSANDEEFEVPVDDLVMRTWGGVRMIMHIAELVNAVEKRDVFLVLFDPNTIKDEYAHHFKVGWFDNMVRYLRKLRFRIRWTFTNIGVNITQTHNYIPVDSQIPPELRDIFGPDFGEGDLSYLTDQPRSDPHPSHAKSDARHKKHRSY